MNQPSDKINIIYDNNQTIQTIKGTTLNDILALIPQRNYAPVGAIVNNELQELDYPLYTDSTVTWVDISTSTGWLIYRRSLTFLLLLAVHECFPDHHLWVSHSLAEGLFCWVEDEQKNRLSATEIAVSRKR